MIIKILIENTTDSELICEHGLSLYIEFENEKYLLDAGTSGDFLQNAKDMSVDVKQVKCAVLSHGHYDHAGGFLKYFEECSNVNVYGMKSAADEYFSGSGGEMHEVGIPKEILEKYYDRFVFLDKVTKIAENVFIVPHSTDNLAEIGKRAKLYKLVGDNLVPDDFSHELSLVFNTEKGLVIFNSCSHGGIINIINEVKKEFPDEKIYAFFGGLHMKGKKNDQVICTFSEDEVKKIGEYINQSGLELLYTGHCTGEPAIVLLRKYMGDKVRTMTTGMVVEV